MDVVPQFSEKSPSPGGIRLLKGIYECGRISSTYIGQLVILLDSHTGATEHIMQQSYLLSMSANFQQQQKKLFFLLLFFKYHLKYQQLYSNFFYFWAQRFVGRSQINLIPPKLVCSKAYRATAFSDMLQACLTPTN